MVEKRLRKFNEIQEKRRHKLGELQDEHDMLAYVNNYDESLITDAGFLRSQRL